MKYTKNKLVIDVEQSNFGLHQITD